jgi:Fe-Mn family superoxide dismutase
MTRLTQRLATRRRVAGAFTAVATTTILAQRGALANPVPARDWTTTSRLQTTPEGPFSLDALPYDFSALEPHIDAMTMEIHHDRHHQAYVNNLNTAVAELPELHEMSAEDLIRNLDQVPEEVRGAVRNNGGGHVNHTLFWEIMTPGGSTEPVGALADAIASDFGDLAALQEAVTTAGLGQFGSGWAWLTLDPEGTLAVVKTPNQDNPIMEGGSSPILGVDVWEHAYYLKYQNMRKDYLTAWWNTVNWDIANERYERALATE